MLQRDASGAPRLMLSDHSEKRDEYGLPIVNRIRRRRIRIYGEGGSKEERRKIDTWKAEHKQTAQGSH